MNVFSTRWDFMRPWCVPVRGKLYMNDGTRSRVSSSYCVGLLVQLPDTPGKMRGVRDALVLLSLIARVDRSAWEYVVSTHCDLGTEHKESDTESDEFDPPRFLLPFNEDTIVDDSVASKLTSFFSGLDALPNAHFAMAARKIASYNARGQSQPIPVDIPVVVTVNAGAECETPHLEHICRALRALKATHSGWRVPVRVSGSMKREVGSIPDVPEFEVAFVLWPIRIEHFVDLLQPRTADVLERLATGDADVAASSVVLIPHLHRDSAADGARRAQMLGKTFGRLLCASGVPKVKRSLLGELCFMCHNDEPAAIARLLSAIAETRTTHSLRLWFDETESGVELTEWVWGLLAYALFSKDTYSTVTDVS